MARPQQIGRTIDVIFKELSAGRKDKWENLRQVLKACLTQEERKHAQPWDLKEGILVLCVDSPAQMYALNLKKEELLRKIKDGVGGELVKSIRLKIGSIDRQWSKGLNE